MEKLPQGLNSIENDNKAKLIWHDVDLQEPCVCSAF